MRAQRLIVLGVVLGAAALAPVVTRSEASSSAGSATRSSIDTSATQAMVAPLVSGTATFYADAYHGQQMANGRTFDMNDPAVAASNDWPLGTRLIVRRAPGSPWESALTDEERADYFNREVEVTVQDRGAFAHELDLSLGAFRLLGRPDEGVIRVQILPAGSQ